MTRRPQGRPRGRPLALLAALVLAACAAPPEGGPDEGDGMRDMLPLPKSTAPAQTDYERRQRDRAATLTRQGRLADAALTWEILAVLRPDVPEYDEQLARTRRQIETAAADRLQRAGQAYKRGEWEAATQWYLAALALQPDNPQAADALRNLERERNKRSYLGKFARITLMQRPAAAGRAADPGPNAHGVPADRNELEHAAMLAVQGEFDGAINLLERRLASGRPDDAARALLADTYFQKAEAMAPGDKAGAIAALEKSLRWSAAHPLAAARLKQLKAPVASTAPSAPASPPRAAPDAGRTGKRGESPDPKPR